MSKEVDNGLCDVNRKVVNELSSGSVHVESHKASVDLALTASPVGQVGIEYLIDVLIAIISSNALKAQLIVTTG